MNRDEIQSIIPVRPPYLWLDEVVEIDERRIHARKFLDPNMEIFAAHYIGFPLFPGALQCEAAFQAAAVLISHNEPSSNGGVPVIARVNNVKFRTMARPGETLDIVVEILDRVTRAIDLKGRISVDARTTTTLDFLATEAPAP